MYRNNKSKIGMNTTANKFYHINNLIGLDMLNKNFVHFKKLAKIQFLKNGTYTLEHELDYYGLTYHCKLLNNVLIAGGVSAITC